MRAGGKLVGAGAVIMALCCAALPFAGAALGGGLVAAAGTIGAVVGIALIGVIALLSWRRRGSADRC